MGLIGACLGGLYIGFRVVLMSPLAFLARPARCLETLHRHRGTVSAAPNFAYELCLAKLTDADLDGLDLSCWRLAFNGAEAVSPDTLERFAARFARCGLKREALTPVYGLAENSVGLAFPPTGRGPLIDRIDRAALAQGGVAQPARPDDAQPLRIVSCGLPLPGHELRVIGAGGRELPEREQGQVQFRGPSSTQGYPVQSSPFGRTRNSRPVCCRHVSCSCCSWGATQPKPTPHRPGARCAWRHNRRAWRGDLRRGRPANSRSRTQCGH